MAEHELIGCEGRRLPLIIGEAESTSVTKTLWTSARCNRLLRPLSSKIALLRKEKQFECQSKERLLTASVIDNAGCKRLIGTDDGTRGLGQHRAPASSIEEDGEWEANPRPYKRIKRTYSSKTKTCISKGSGNEAVNTTPEPFTNNAVIELPSQLLSGPRQLEIPQVDDAGCQRLPQTSRDPFPISTLPKDSVPANWKLVDGICKAFAALLKATNIWKLSHNIGCRSLLSTCVRKVPRYIDVEEALLKVDEPDSDVDVPTMVYNDLEQYGSMPGWEPLRLLVRTHGVQLITDAIQEGLLGLLVAKHVYHICLDVFANDEAQCIIRSLISLDRFGQSPAQEHIGPNSLDLHLIVTKLDNLAFGCGRRGFLYRQTAAMLDSCTITTDWISSKPMVRTWNEAIRSITQGDEDAQAAALLLRTAVKASYKTGVAMPRDDVDDLRLRLHQASHRPTLRSSRTNRLTEDIISTQPKALTTDKVQRKNSDSGEVSTLVNVLTVLTAVARLQGLSIRTASGSSTLALTVLQELAFEVSQAIELSQQGDWNQHLREPCGDSLQLCLLAAGLAELPSNQHDHEFSSQDIPCLNALADLASSKEIFSGAGPFLCTVARYCGRANSDDPFDVIKVLVDDLATISKSACAVKTTRKLCRELALAAAFTYSEDTSRPVHLDWALRVEANLTRKNVSTPRPAAMKTPLRSDSRRNDCFRWEEGICEWIMKTPALQLQKPSVMKSEPSQLRYPSPALSDGTKHTPPLSTQKAPSTTDTVKNDGQGPHELGGVKALHVLIQAETSNSGNGIASKELRSKKQSSTNQGSLKVSLDFDDFDELSTHDSSQEATSVLSTLREPPNVACGTKRKRSSKRQQPSKVVSDSLIDSSQSQAGETKHELDVMDVDELAGMFKW